MLTESFIAATLTVNKAVAHASAALKDVGIFLHELQPQTTYRHGYKKSSVQPGCVDIGDSHILAAQADKAVINVYSRERGNQEATVPFPEKIHSLAFAQRSGILVLGTDGGRLILWETFTGRVKNSAASHLQPVSCLVITPDEEYILSGSEDGSVHVWSLSKIVSFHHEEDVLGTQTISNAPVHTFSRHKSGVTAIACGHSGSSTNFAVSASQDGTCYLWHIRTCQHLRTLLLPSMAVSIILDPADRAIYFGSSDGPLLSWAIFEQSSTGVSSLSRPSELPPVQLLERDAWKAPTTETGPANCLALSYDGMTLLSGHPSGAILRWDVAKHRLLNEVVNLSQPVTNLHMLKPDGFPLSEIPEFPSANVVKPDLGFSALTNHGSSGIPVKYNLQTTIRPPKWQQPLDDVDQALTSSGFPQSMLDDALRGLAMGAAGGTEQTLPSTDPTEKARTELLEDEISKLKRQIEVLHAVEQKRHDKRLAKFEKMEELGLKKREAYFDARKKGKDGDAAMKKWEEQEVMLDVESEE